jgi:ribosomal protein S18 acetylase RimI-like enzyme
VLGRLEAYYDAVPRSAARTEEHGPLTLFVAEGVPWPYYARPRLGEAAALSPADVARVRERQRELGVAEAFEWVHETTPSLLPAAEAAGLDVLRAPLLVLDRAAWLPHDPPAGVRVRMLDPDDADLAAATAVAHVAFSVAGTAAGPAGADRDLVASGFSGEQLEARRARMRERLTATAAATDADGPLCVGSHQPVGDVTEIVGVGTLPAARRRGLAAAVTSRLVEDADARGVEVVFLSAGSEEIARVYGRLGFRRLGTACIAEPPAEQS